MQIPNCCRGLVVLVIAIAFPQMSTGEPRSELDATTIAQAKRKYESYRTWKPNFSEPRYVQIPCSPAGEVDKGAHESRFVLTYVSPIARKLYDNALPDAKIYPEGTVIVKEKYRNAGDKQPAELGIMIKHSKGWSRETRDWQYLFVNRDGKVVGDKQLHNCSTCHDNAKNDSVFGYPPRYR